MFEALIYIGLGLGVLVAGGEVLLRGAVAIAQLCRISPAVVGLTVVAAVTSVPELAVSLSEALRGSSDIAVGNVVGSNITNASLILGLGAVIAGLSIAGQTIRLEYPVLVAVTYLFIVVSGDGLISRLDGSLFVLLFVLFTLYLVGLVRDRMNQVEQEEFSAEVKEIERAEPSRKAAIGYTLAGVVLLWGGAELTVVGAVDLASLLGMSDRVIGLTVVAVGTSLPEIVATVISSVRGRDDVAVGNVIGSNLFNILIILGVTSLIRPISVNPAIISSDNWWMLGGTLLLFPIMRSGFRISRREGVLLMGAYVVYVGILLAQP